jgi:hypothetical protein
LPVQAGPVNPLSETLASVGTRSRVHVSASIISFGAMTIVTVIFLAFLVVLFLGLIGFQLLGYRFGARRRAAGRANFAEGTSAIETSLFALLGLLIAFSISGGEARLDARRHLVVEEANAIGTAYLRLDLMPAATQAGLRGQFRDYVDARIAYYDHLLQLDQARADHARAGELQRRLWTEASTAAMSTPDTRPAMIALPAINEMIDVTTARDAAQWMHVPIALFALLIALALACGFFAGLGMSKNPRPNKIHIVAFAGTLALTAYVIANIEFPRVGLTALRLFDTLLIQVRQQMG